MAEGLLRHETGGRYDAFGAGLEAGSLRPEAIEVMREIGIDIAPQKSTTVDIFAGQPFAALVIPGSRRRERARLPEEEVAQGQVDGRDGDRQSGDRKAIPQESQEGDRLSARLAHARHDDVRRRADERRVAAQTGPEG